MGLGTKLKKIGKKCITLVGISVIIYTVGYIGMIAIGNKTRINTNTDNYSFEAKKIYHDLSIEEFERTITNEEKKIEDCLSKYALFGKSFSIYDGGLYENHDGKVDKIILNNYEFAPGMKLNGILERTNDYSKHPSLFDIADRKLAEARERHKPELAKLEELAKAA